MRKTPGESFAHLRQNENNFAERIAKAKKKLMPCPPAVQNPGGGVLNSWTLPPETQHMNFQNYDHDSPQALIFLGVFHIYHRRSSEYWN